MEWDRPTTVDAAGGECAVRLLPDLVGIAGAQIAAIRSRMSLGNPATSGLARNAELLWSGNSLHEKGESLRQVEIARAQQEWVQ
ncbi:MAG: hypothetical protein JW829_19060 [Pirellulales bacterium]|nr:hypothetical protein [Pirellulales bacterium]